MKDPLSRQRESKRLEGHAATADKLPTYQELLDEALDETFPASDPISPGAAARAQKPVKTPRDGIDWTLNPGKKRG